MTYCTRCWCIGHTRDKCQRRNARCRICLDDLTEGQLHHCTNVPRCAQCDSNHHSLSSECEKVTKYRSDLKEQVNQALSSGKLNRLQRHEHAEIQQFQMQPSEHPSLPAVSVPRGPVWSRTTAQTGMETNANVSQDTTQILMEINRNVLELKDKVQDINEHINQINDKINQTTHDIEQHHETLKSLMVFLSSLVRDFIGPATETSRLPQLQNLFDEFKKIKSQFETKYNN